MEPPQDIDIRFESRHLEDYFDWEHAHPPTQAPAPVLADASFVAGLNLFTTTLKSQVLYAHGSYQTHGPDLLQQSTSVYKSLAEEAGVAVVSYFCELSNADPPANRSRESMELSALLCALIRQLVNLLPSGGSEQAARLDPSRFAVLDGTLRTYKEALSLIEDLARCVRLPMMLFIIHGLNILEEEAGNTIIEVLEDLVNCFVRMANPVSTDEEGIVKVLFTSSGLSDVLCNLINEEDMVACDSSTPGGGKRARRGRQVLSY